MFIAVKALVTAGGIACTPKNSRFWILAKGASIPTSVPDTCATYAFTGTTQQFTVPAGVAVVWVRLIGGSGYVGSGFGAPGGFGDNLYFTRRVVPGERWDVDVGGGGVGVNPFTGRWPNGGNGGTYAGGAGGGAGGGSTSVRPQGGTFAQSYGVAGGGGGGTTGAVSPGPPGQVGTKGGDGRFPIGGDGLSTTYDSPGTYQGKGGTNLAGGAGAPAGAFNQGGSIPQLGSLFVYGGGGGGGGWYGGGAGNSPIDFNWPQLGCGGGGSGYLAAGSIELTDAANSVNAHGSCEICWVAP